jgi:hypothetical protein
MLGKDRYTVSERIDFYMDQVAEAGVVVSLSTAGSGFALDPPENQVVAAASPSGQTPIGVLLQPVEDIDYTTSARNWNKLVVAKGDKVPLLNNGWVVTDKIIGTPVAGQRAVLSSSGNIAAEAYNAAPSQLPVIGKFLSSKDENGFAKVQIQL